MTPIRQFRDLSFYDATETLEEEHGKTPDRDLIMYRQTGAKDEFGVDVCDVYTFDDLATARFSMDDFESHNWIFEDRGPEEIPAPEVQPDRSRSFMRDDILSAVAAEVGQFYYKNPDSHKIAIGVVRRLGFPE